MLAILGGGPAGLAALEESTIRNRACLLLEAAQRVGGHCVTFRRGLFRYDAGAHRLHDKDPRVTAKLMALMGDELHQVTAPSHICTAGRVVTFPLALSALPFELGVGPSLAAAVAYLVRPRGADAPRTFEELAVRTYGRPVAERFLLSYSEKLWGVPCSRLLPEVAGQRLRGLHLRSLLTAIVPGRHRSAPHMEGTFYYPHRGFGRICARLAEAVGSECIRTGARVTGLVHDGTRVTGVEINHAERLAVDAVCSTLALPLAVRLLRPAAPPPVLTAAATLRHRNLVLVALFLNRPSVTDSASIYFPDPDVPFTRVVEPRNRSAAMAPPGQTSLVAEIPCFDGDEVWRLADAVVAERVVASLSGLGLIARDEVFDFEVRRLPGAYPVLEVGAEESVRRVLGYLSRFANLATTGRNGRFVYRHLHDMIRCGADAVATLDAHGHLRPRAPAPVTPAVDVGAGLARPMV